MRMRALISVLGLAASCAAQAALPVGAAAPDFTADAALGGQPFSFHLADALKKGPVVLYFFPKAFTSGCTVEAHLFAEATDAFKAHGASVVGMSFDRIDTVRKFSTEECRSKFAVAADPDSKVIQSYDAKLVLVPGGMADRVSFLIGQDGKVKAVYSSMAPEGHVKAMLAAVEQLHKHQ
ncbi:MAG: peroxiredoxin [Pelomonas sp.]|nr:peroxiredoxin [Roseateles sp.]